MSKNYTLHTIPHKLLQNNLGIQR